MIISASRRTDIPSFYADWFFTRLKEGYVCVRNPMNYNSVSRISLLPDDVDFIVFWTKDPKGMIGRMHHLNSYQYYFQYTLNAYDINIEKQISSQQDRIKRFIELSDIIGPDKVIWRYDPIMLFGDINEEYHYVKFEALAKKLSSYTRKCIISFVDIYKKNITKMRNLGCNELSYAQMKIIVKNISSICKSYDLQVETCAEENTFSEYNVNSGKCIDDKLISNICKRKVCIDKDKTQREVCGCVSSVDIGSYNTCPHSCMYCYANYSDNAMMKNCEKHITSSPLISGELTINDKITERKNISIFRSQDDLFDY